jgi:hypothetical protein
VDRYRYLSLHALQNKILLWYCKIYCILFIYGCDYYFLTIFILPWTLEFLGAEIPDVHDLSSGVLCQGYVIASCHDTFFVRFVKYSYVNRSRNHFSFKSSNTWYNLFCYWFPCRWTIETKYYSADLSIWTANLGEEFSLGSLPHLDRVAALVMVFDMSDVRTEPAFSFNLYCVLCLIVFKDSEPYNFQSIFFYPQTSKLQ